MRPVAVRELGPLLLLCGAAAPLSSEAFSSSSLSSSSSSSSWFSSPPPRLLVPRHQQRRQPRVSSIVPPTPAPASVTTTTAIGTTTTIHHCEPNNDSDHNQLYQRRAWFAHVVRTATTTATAAAATTTTAFIPNAAVAASDDQAAASLTSSTRSSSSSSLDYFALKEAASNPSSRRPYAPNAEALTPLVVIQQQLQRALAITQQLSPTDNPSSDTLRSRLGSLVAPPPSTPSNPPYVVLPSIFQARQAFQQDQRLVQQAFFGQQQNGVVPLSGPLVRAACNVYTAQLRFDAQSYLMDSSQRQSTRGLVDDSMMLEQQQQKQQPSVTQVVVADLDLRDLYRNQLQDAIEDLQAELYVAADPELEEVQQLLRQALTAWDSWWALIDPWEQDRAQQVVQQQQKQQKE